MEVKDRYKYLGVDVPEKFTSWTYHVERLIKKAQARSSELLWLCRRDRGLRPRAAVKMWQALVRPILEYAGELWAGEVPKSLEDRVEQVQTKFGKALLGLQDRIWIPADAVRAELGMERLATRREKLRLGYWWRIQNSQQERALFQVAQWRREQVLGGQGRDSWMHGTRALLQERGLGEYWRAQDKCRGLDKEVWKGGVRHHVDEHHDGAREGHQIPMMAQYNRVKNWDPTPAWRAHTRKEIDRRGALVMERYLDDKMERMGKTLLTQCRMGCLPVMRRVAEEERLSVGWGECLLCRGHIESQDHLLLQCRAHGRDRARLMARVNALIPPTLTQTPFALMSPQEQVDTLLGGPEAWRRGAGRALEISRAAKRFLRMAWRRRRHVTRTVNERLGRHDLVDLDEAPTETIQTQEAGAFVSDAEPTRARLDGTSRRAQGQEKENSSGKRAPTGAGYKDRQTRTRGNGNNRMNRRLTF